MKIKSAIVGVIISLSLVAPVKAVVIVVNTAATTAAISASNVAIAASNASRAAVIAQQAKEVEAKKKAVKLHRFNVRQQWLNQQPPSKTSTESESSFRNFNVSSTYEFR